MVAADQYSYLYTPIVNAENESIKLQIINKQKTFKAQ